MSLTPRRTVLKAGAAALASGALAVPAVAAESVPRANGVNDDEWMRHLNDHVPLTGLTIPGSHDTCCTDPMHGTEWSHTQNWGIPDQLRRGIRFLDIRCNGLAGTASELGIYHSDNYQYIRLQDVLNQCASFLSAHPSEGLVMRLRNEYAGGNKLDSAEFQRRFNFYMDDFGFRRWFWTNPWWPTLGEARGKIVLVADFDNPWTVIQWSSGANTWFDTQDRWDGMENFQKARLVTAQFDKAFLNPAAKQMFTNFTSFAGGFNFPRHNARFIMPEVLKYLDARKTQKARFGIVPMDFPDQYPEVLRLLIDKNFIG
ncbi:phosphatidylinositol-specific phospholipase C [Kitasatospora aureofaciens]|uniref:phosphatidylinositol-specific phospholipase C n=1 Tax=Kitasatospora aureofaciens TaxID=1894 RepID=UPI00210E69EC|nr:phosphatidylinositol-specific phospholipase C [Kitasatospora aureofaciens]